ncbi:DUF1838 family protein [Candidatus Foliamicus sp.]
MTQEFSRTPPSGSEAPGRLSRRAMLGGLGALGLGGALSIEAAHAASGGIFPEADDKDAWLKSWMRMQASFEEQDSPWWYMGRIYAQIGESEPRHILDLEGTEIYWARPLGDGQFSISSRTLTFFKDPATGEMLDEFANPYTGENIPVRPNILGGRDGARYSNEGMTFSERIDPSGQLRRWNWQWTHSGRHVWLMASRGMQHMPQPWLEAFTMFCLADDFADSSISSLRSSFSSTYFSPWLHWMGMEGREGHLIWHSSGCKLESVDEVSEAYRERADRLFPGKLTANPDSFD